MGKKAKEHRKKVAKRNAKINAEKYAMKKVINEMWQKELEKAQNEELTAKLGNEEIQTEIVEDRVIDHAFKFIPNEEESAKINKEFEPEYDSAGYTIEDRELPTEE